jgi:hypothetical protein
MGNPADRVRDIDDTRVGHQNALAADVVEHAIAVALEGAAAACRFDVVAQLAKELEARRLARIGNVVAFRWKTRQSSE